MIILIAVIFYHTESYKSHKSKFGQFSDNKKKREI